MTFYGEGAFLSTGFFYGMWLVDCLRGHPPSTFITASVSSKRRKKEIAGFIERQ